MEEAIFPSAAECGATSEAVLEAATRIRKTLTTIIIADLVECTMTVSRTTTEIAS